MQPVRTRRKNKFNFVKEAERLESFDEFPMLRPEVDPQLHVSRNSVDQPFYLRCEKDSVIAQATGSSRVEFVDGPTRYFDTEPGDYVYVPAGYAHRVRTRRQGVMLRYKARDYGNESIEIRCCHCGEPLHVERVSEGPVQAGYSRACEVFNSSERVRTCPACQTENAKIDVSQFRWSFVAEALLSGEQESDERA